jgi:hypothetical protein
MRDSEVRRALVDEHDAGDIRRADRQFEQVVHASPHGRSDRFGTSPH